MDVGGVLHGDPLEASALEGIRWDWNATSHTASPRVESVDSHKNGARKKRTKETEVVEEDDGVAVAVWRRHAFSSQLQRMSVIAEVSGSVGMTGDGPASPEVRILMLQ